MYSCIMCCMLQAVDPVFLVFVLIVTWNLYVNAETDNFQTESEPEHQTDDSETDSHSSNVDSLRDERSDVINDKDVSSDERWHLERQRAIQQSKLQMLLEIERGSYKERQCESTDTIKKIEDNIKVINERIKTLETASLPGKHKDSSAASKKVQDKQTGKMRDPDYNNIQTHMVYLLDNIQDPIYLCLSLFSHGVFDWDDVEKIKRCHAIGTREATEKLLFILMYCGENAYGRFLVCLRDVGLDQVINELEHSRYGESNRQGSEEQRLLAERRGLQERVKEKEEQLREAVTEKEHNFQKLQEDNQRINMGLVELRNQMMKMETEKQGDKDERKQEISLLREKEDELLNVQKEVTEKQQRIPNEILNLESHVEYLKAATISGDNVESDITNLCTLLQTCATAADDKEISSEQEERWQRVGQLMIQQFKDQREGEISNLQKLLESEKGSYKERESEFADTISELKDNIKDISERIKTLGRPSSPGQHKDSLAAPRILQGRRRSKMRDPDFHNIQTHLVYLLDNIRDPKRLCVSLFSHGVFDRHDVELIYKCYDDGTREATDKLLMTVMYCGADAYQRFLECLRDVGLNQVINELEQSRYGEPSDQQTEELRLIAERRGLLEWVQEKEKKLQETVKEKRHDVEELQVENKRINMELAELRNVISKMEKEKQGDEDEREQEISLLREKEDELLKDKKKVKEKQQRIPNEIHNLESQMEDLKAATISEDNELPEIEADITNLCTLLEKCASADDDGCSQLKGENQITTEHTTSITMTEDDVSYDILDEQSSINRPVELEMDETANQDLQNVNILNQAVEKGYTDKNISSETDKRWHDKRDSEISKLESEKERGFDSNGTIKKLEDHIEDISARIKTLEAPNSPGENKESLPVPRKFQDKQIGMMRKSDYQNIQEHMMYLIDNIQDPIRLSLTLFACGVFNRDDVEKIKRCYNISTRDATQKLLFIVMYSGVNVYQRFIECLREEGLDQVVNELEQNRHRESDQQRNEELRLKVERVQESGESLREVVKERESDIRKLKGENERINTELVELRDEMAKLENDKQRDKEERIIELSLLKEKEEALLKHHKEIDDKHSKIQNDLKTLESLIENIKATTISGKSKDGADQEQLTRSKKRTHFSNLDDACLRGDLYNVRRLIDSGHDIYKRFRDGMTPLLFCSQSEIEPVSKMKMILDKGANIYDTDTDNNNVLHLACGYSHLATVEYLLNLGLFDNSGGFKDKTPILCSSESPIEPVSKIKMILDRGGNINDRDTEDNNILHLACKWGSLETVDYLLQVEGLDVMSRNKFDRTPLDCCRSSSIQLDEKIQLFEDKMQLSGKYYSPLFDFFN
ncbi:repetitive organellar protein isoform X2 [Patella vulgata]|uniref:repetitive organellar protein isoform X2 n=1 Tax=Patella vulgata TaxID=6465 RepID=UPI0024A8BD61|nr:repetitive organellar protein isoform X2 [Patella vulgata]